MVQTQKSKKRFYGLLRTACVLMSVLMIALASGCDFLDGDNVTVSPKTVEIEIGESIGLLATSAEGLPISWTSSDEEIALVDDEGVVTGVSAGETTVTASDGKKQASCEITVKAPTAEEPNPNDPEDPEEPEDPNAPKVTISSSTVTITVGGSVTLKATASDGSAITWSSSDSSIASVLRGKVTGEGEGTAIITASSTTAGSAACTVKVNPRPRDDYELVWSDEFDGNSLDMKNWNYQTGIKDNYYGNSGPDFWGNDELEYYTDGANVKVVNGELQITAKRENMPNGRTFSSARITTRDLHTFTYGIIEAKMKTPAIEGMWPAFWMLPQPPNHSSTNNVYGGWPANGELDIMEAKGRLGNVIDTTLHFGGPDYKVHDMAGKSTTLSSSTEEWHTYAVEWTAQYIAWIIDGNEVYRVSNSRWWTSATESPSAPFDQPFYIVLNLAVGGMYDSYKNPPADFKEATMYVDYVRVYQKNK